MKKEMKNEAMKRVGLIFVVTIVCCMIGGSVQARDIEAVPLDGSLYVSDGTIGGIVRCLPETLEPSDYYLGLGYGFMHCSSEGELFFGDEDNIWRIKNDWSQFRYSGEDQHQFVVPSIDALFSVNYAHLAYLEDENGDGFLNEFTETEHLITPAISTFAFKGEDYSTVYFVKTGTNMLFSSPPVAGAPSTLIVSDPLINNMHSLIYGEDGIFYGLRENRENIVKITEDGSSVTELLISSPLINAKQLVWGPDDNLYVADGGADNIFRIDPTDGNVTTLFTEGTFPDPRGIAFAIERQWSTAIYHVDDATGDNTDDGLSREAAFKTIQRGITVATDGDTVLVWPGVYTEQIVFLDKAITVISAADAATLRTDYGWACSFYFGEGQDSVLSNFIIADSEYGIYLESTSSPTLENLTIVNCDYAIAAFDGSGPSISNCIFWNNSLGDLFGDPDPIDAQYSFVDQEDEPGFVDAGAGDYHLLSERGRYWPEHDVWVLDGVTSPCIDGGDPAEEPVNEPAPNGGRINMGAYGGTAYASMSEWPLEYDSNRDGIVNLVDLANMAAEWLERLAWAGE